MHPNHPGNSSVVLTEFDVGKSPQITSSASGNKSTGTAKPIANLSLTLSDTFPRSASHRQLKIREPVLRSLTNIHLKTLHPADSQIMEEWMADWISGRIQSIPNQPKQ
jgi:hypothetical protein